MAPLPALPDPMPAEMERVADAIASDRGQGAGRAMAGGVYGALLHSPAFAEVVGQLGALARYHSIFPADISEMAICGYAARRGYDYEIAHHAALAVEGGLTSDQVVAVCAGEIPTSLRPDQIDALKIVDAVCRGVSLPAETQESFAAVYGTRGVVELVALCGHYGIMGYIVTSFDVPIGERARAATEAVGVRLP